MKKIKKKKIDLKLVFNQEEYVLFPLLFLLKNVFKPRSADLEITLGTWNWSLPWTILLCKMWTSFTLVVQLLSCVWLFATPWTATCQASLSFTISWSLLKFTSIESVMSSNHLILCCLLLLPSIFPSIRVFSNESGVFQWVGSSHQVAKVLELQFQHQSFQ